MPWPGAGLLPGVGTGVFSQSASLRGCVGLLLGKGWEHSRCPAELGAQSGFPLQQQAGPAPEPGASVLTPPLRPCREESGLSLCSSPSDAQELCERQQPKGKEAAVCHLQGNYLVPALQPLTSATWCRCWKRPQACAVAVTRPGQGAFLEGGLSFSGNSTPPPPTTPAQSTGSRPSGPSN